MFGSLFHENFKRGCFYMILNNLLLYLLFPLFIGDFMFRSLFFLCAMICSISGFCDQNANYSSAVTAGDFIYVSAQLPVDPLTGMLIEGDIETLTNQVIDNIEHLLKIKGVTLKQVIKTEVYLKDIRDYQAMDSAYGERFNFQYPPARDVVGGVHLPFNARIEISCVAYKKRI